MLQNLVDAFIYTAPLWFLLIGLLTAIIAVDGLN